MRLVCSSVWLLACLSVAPASWAIGGTAARGGATRATSGTRTTLSRPARAARPTTMRGAMTALRSLVGSDNADYRAYRNGLAAISRGRRMIDDGNPAAGQRVQGNGVRSAQAALGRLAASSDPHVRQAVRDVSRLASQVTPDPDVHEQP